jgi:hypothetical protein
LSRQPNQRHGIGAPIVRPRDIGFINPPSHDGRVIEAEPAFRDVRLNASRGWAGTQKPPADRRIINGNWSNIWKPSATRSSWSQSPVADSAAPETQLAQVISNRAISYPGPIEAPAAEALWAIQAWYVDLGDERRAEALLVDGLTPHRLR